MLSVVVITKNEQGNIKRCLESVRWVDDIIVVDAFSTDDTVQIARQYTNKVWTKEWVNYTQQKNYAISLAKNDWILNIDADEVVSEELAEEIKIILRKPEYNGYLMPMQTYYFGRFLKYGGFCPDYHLRLFNKNYGKFESKFTNVHEGIFLNGKSGILKEPIIHYAYSNITQYFGKFNNYTTKEANGLFERNIYPTGYKVFIKPIHRFLKSYFFKFGFLDGIQGLLACAFASFYIFITQIKLIELYKDKYNRRLLWLTLFQRKS
ncbi:MAG: glycosyltransferase family 2 protein [Candidatus Firestonebacteria bacterium]